MFVLSHDNAVYRVVAMLVTLSLVLWGVGAHMLQTAEAANLTYVKNTLSDSNPGSVSDHEIEFVIPAGSAGVESGESITVTFPNGFNISTSGAQLVDYDLEVDGVDETVVLTGAGVADWTLSTSSQDVVFTSGGASATIGAGATVTIKIGSNADGGTSRVTNHLSTTSYEFYIVSGDAGGAGEADTGRTRVAIVENVLVTANISTRFDFVVSGFPTLTGINVNGTSTTGTTSAIAIPFGNLSAWNVETLAQRLNVTTNARQGFVVTVGADTEFISSTGAIIDSLFDGSATNTPSNWAAPSNTVTLNNTWGHWGLTSDDDLNGGEFQACSQAGTQGCWVAASTTQPREIFEHSGPADGIADNIGSTTVGYQVQITPLQEAGDDYQTTLTYVATPTF